MLILVAPKEQTPPMQNLFLIFFCLSAGILLQKIKAIPPKTSQYLNDYLIYVVLPALALLYLPKIDFQLSLLLPIAAAWIGFGISWLLFGLLGNRLNWGDSITGCLVITVGLANTSFIGYPLVKALYGEEGVQIALLVDQPGSFIIVSSLAVIVASIYSKGKKRKRDILGKILKFPPFLFFMIAIIMNINHWEAEGYFSLFLGLITATLTPVALLAVGLKIKINLHAISSQFLWIGLGYKLILIPAIIFFLYSGVFRLEGLMLNVSVIQMAMAPMITASIIAISHDLEPQLASLLVGVGTPLSFITIGIWYLLLG